MSNKRQRTTTSVESLCINDLPDGILVGISSYLAKPSAALLAIAMMADSQQQTETSKAIISSTINCSVLDFGDIEKSLSVKLSDDDIDKILRSIDAVNNLRILKLAGCVNITGRGLDVLRSSNEIQQIDLSLVGKHESPLIEPEPLLSEDVVIPILDSIISRGRESSLKQLELPMMWRNESSVSHQFFGRYNDYLTNQRYCCSKCEQVIGSNDWVCLDGDDWHGTQEYTCSQCLKHFCYDEDCEDESSLVNWCNKCEKGYCKNCNAGYKCSGCYRSFCNECKTMKACEAPGDCTRRFCGDCSEEKLCSWCDQCSFCVRTAGVCKHDGCQKTICSQCDVVINTGGYCMECGL